MTRQAVVEATMISRVVNCAVFLFILVLAPRGRAVTFDPLPLEALTRQADVIVQGTILSKSCQRDQAGRIYTKIELQVADLWKGAVPGSVILIVHGGGILGEEQAVVSGQVQYTLNEEVVAFLVRNQRGEAVTLGLAQGKFAVWQDPVTKRKYVSNPFHGTVGAPSAVAVRGGPDPNSGAAPFELSQFRKRVREASL